MNNDEAIKQDQIRISVEIGADCDVSPRLRAALDELRDALDESAEVSGFVSMGLDAGSWVYDSTADGFGSSGYPPPPPPQLPPPKPRPKPKPKPKLS